MTTTGATAAGAVIGTGPVATVYSGLYEGVPVALKVFPGKAARRALSVFEREQNKLRAKAVPSVVPVHGVEQLPDGRSAVRMELCTQSLAALVRRAGRLDPSNVIVMGHAAATALAAAHKLGVVHGGVNPNNVLFRATGEPLLSDFGVTLRHAFARDPLQSVESLPPETLRDDILDQRTDLYGLGVVLHVALTGRWPHPGRLGEHLGERVLRVLGEPVPAINLPGVSVELTTVVARLLAADPAHRPPDAASVANQLATMLTARRPPATPRPPMPGYPGQGVPQPGYPGTPSQGVPLGQAGSPVSGTGHPGYPSAPMGQPGQIVYPGTGVPPVVAAGSSGWPVRQGISGQGVPVGAAGQAALPAGAGTPVQGVPVSPAPAPSVQPSTPEQAVSPVAPEPGVSVGSQSQPVAPDSGASASPAPPGDVPVGSQNQADQAAAAASPVQPVTPGSGVPVAGRPVSPVGPPTSGSASAGPPGQPGQAIASGPVTSGPGSAAPGQDLPVSAPGQSGSSTASPVQPGTPDHGVPMSVAGQAVAPPAPTGPPQGQGSAMGAPPAVGRFNTPAPPGADDPTVVGGVSPVPVTDEPTVVAGAGSPVPHGFSEDSDSFDDFAAVRGAAPQPEPDEEPEDLDDIADRLGWGDTSPSTPDSGGAKSKQVNKYYLFVGAGTVVLLVVIALIMALQADPPELSTTPHMPLISTPTAPATPAAQINLGEPDLRDGKVVLTWTSNPEKLDFFVVVTQPGAEPQRIVVHRNHTASIDVAAVGGYCFQVGATNSGPNEDIYYSQTRSIRGYDCRN